MYNNKKANLKYLLFLYLLYKFVLFAWILPKNITNLSMSKGSLLHKGGKEVYDMTQAELILNLVEQLLAERDKNNSLQSKLEETKKSKD